MVNALAAAASGVGRLNDAILWVCRWAVILIVAALAVILGAGVFWRYVLNDAIAWSEEGSKYLMVWLAFLGAPIALRHNAHVNVDLLVALLPGRARQASHLLVAVIILATMGVLVWQGALFAAQGARQVASSFGMSMVWVYGVVPAGALLMGLVALEHGLKAAVGIRDPDRGFKEDHAYAEEIRE
ncbi:MAG: TRAP transporter small permease [Geminicoccaceae bacterium]|nr:TRAP transporter small permease [Geminicoccaceae bacterium]